MLRKLWISALLISLLAACSDEGTGTDTSPSCEGSECEGLLVVEPSGSTTTEAGGQVTLELRLEQAPSADVVVDLSVSDESEASLGTTQVTFTSENWNGVQSVVVTGVDDELADGEQPYQVAFSALQSDDSIFEGFVPAAIDLANTDDESAGITVGEPDGDTGENGDQASFTVVLNAKPTAAVTIALVSENTDEGTVSPATLEFTPDNYAAPQTVTATGVDDDLADGAQTYQIVFEAADSDDDDYAGMLLDPVELTNVDNDTAGITVGAPDGDTGENGDQASFTVVLNSEPTADVTLNLASSDPDEGTAAPSTLTFSTENWSAPQTVLVTGQDDDVADGNQRYEITFEAAQSDDAGYADLALDAVELDNVDNDSAGITVSSISGNTDENGAQATFTVVLNSEPIDDVTVNFDSNNTDEGSVGNTSLTFTSANWNAPQTVTVTGQDDDLADGDQPYAVAFSATTSTDTAYAAITPANVSVTNTDNDSAGITVGSISGNTDESGSQATFTVVLNSEPFADVTVNFDSNDSDEGTVGNTSLTFTSANWNAPQTVTVTGQDDDLADGDQPYAVAFSATTSTDAAYAAITPSNIAVSNTDDDSAGFTVSTISGNTAENGGQATFTVVLNSEPFDDVTVNFDSNDSGEGTVGNTSLTFTSANWNAPQTVTVTGQDDDLADGDQPFAVAFSATTSNDAAYAAITPANVSVTNTDNDSAGITVGSISGNTDENGAQATFTVVLNSEPFADVTVNFSSTDSGEGTVDNTSLTFTSANWNAPQTVTVTGQDDDLADGDQPYAVAFSATTSTDAAYAAITPGNVAATNTDDDSAGITVSAISGNTDENGTQATFTVVLNSEPFDDVTVNINSNDTGEGTVSNTSLAFTPTNWNAPQTVTLTGQDDDLADGDQPYAVVFGATTSNDAAYAAITPSNLATTNTDDDSAGITVSAISGNTVENGAQATFTVVLNSEPFDDVTINFDSNDASEGTLDRTSLTFTSANWNAPQTVTVTGQDDDLADGDQPYAVAFSATTSNDAAYAAITPANVSVTNTDDDSAGISVSSISGNTAENGGQATFTVVLNSQPFDDVTVSFDTNDASEGTIGTTGLTFTPMNWNAPQTVTLTGQDDALDDGDQPYAVVFGATTSNDAAYAAITPGNVAVSNTDNDTAGFTITTVNATSTEDGGAANFSMALNSEPFDDVTVDFDTNDASEATPSVTTLTFTPLNWASPQNVLVTGQDDDLADGEQPYAITFGATTSNDAAYAALTPGNVALSNIDNDTAGIDVSAISGNTTEAGGTATFSVVLLSEPFNDVTINFDSNDAGEGTPNTTSLTFTASDWKVPQAITVTGQDDDVADGTQPYTIAFSATTSSDAAYAAITPSNISVNNTDDDTAGISISPLTANTSEAGGQATFDVVLNSEPTADVVLTYASSDASEGTASPGSLTFTPDNWDITQQIVVSGVDDGLQDGNKMYTLDFSASSSADTNYDSITLQKRSLTNVDNEVPAVGTSGTTGVISGDSWTVCRADNSTAWVAANNSGEYNPTEACQSLGYSSVDAWGGTCGTVCGYCGTLGNEYYGGGGGSNPTTFLRYTAHWRCVR